MYCQEFDGFSYKRYSNGESWYAFYDKEQAKRFFWLLVAAGLYMTNSDPDSKYFYFKSVGQTTMIGLGV